MDYKLCTYTSTAVTYVQANYMSVSYTPRVSA